MKKLSFLTRSNKGGFLLALIVTIYSINLLLIITYVDFLDNEFNNSSSSSSTSSFSLLNILLKTTTTTTTSVSGNGNGGDDAGPIGSYSHFCPRRKNQNENVEQFNNNKSKKARYHPIILWGIPTYDDREEAQRRNAIRESYLSYYDSTTPNRICSLSNYTCFDEETRSQCQIVYTFFMGANPNAPTERLATMNDNGNGDDFRTLTISSPPSDYGIDRYHGEEAAEDITYLNIQENQFDGKMTTWFYFGSLVAKEFPSIEYIAKVDSDTLVFIPNYLDYMEQNLPSPPSDNNKQQQRVYVGRANDRYACDINLKNHDHPCPLPLVGDIYMTGDLNMMTTNLAEYITSNECPRRNVTISSHEDISISNYVYSHKEKITSVVIPNHKLLVTATHDMDYNSVNLKQQFGTTNITYYLWAHSKRQTNFDYFKHIWNYNRIWKKFERKLKHQQEYSSTYIPKKVV